MKQCLCLVFALLTLLACNEPPVFCDYRATPVDGWEPCDTLVFDIDTLRNGGSHAMDVLVRASAVQPYPFQTLWLVLEQEWVSPALRRTDTLACTLATSDGDITGHGVAHYQYAFPLDTLVLPAGEKGRVTIRHIMRSNGLKGITDVGIKLSAINHKKQ